MMMWLPEMLPWMVVVLFLFTAFIAALFVNVVLGDLVVALVSGVIAGIAALFHKGKHAHGTYNPRHWVGQRTGWEVRFHVQSIDDVITARQWCAENCKGRWKVGLGPYIETESTMRRWMRNRITIPGIAYFSRDKDAVLFRLYHDAPE